MRDLIERMEVYTEARKKPAKTYEETPPGAKSPYDVNPYDLKIGAQLNVQVQNIYSGVSSAKTTTMTISAIQHWKYANGERVYVEMKDSRGRLKKTKSAGMHKAARTTTARYVIGGRKGNGCAWMKGPKREYAINWIKNVGKKPEPDESRAHRRKGSTDLTRWMI